MTVALALTVATVACDRDAATTGPPAPGNPPASPTSADQDGGEWVLACVVLVDADVQSATNGYGTQITVVRHTAEEERTESNGCMSTCWFELAGRNGAQTLTAGGMEFRIEERGADLYFPPHRGEEEVAGLGDGAFWQVRQPPALLVRKGARLYAVQGTVPLIGDRSPAETEEVLREVLLKIARTVLGRV